MHLKTAIQVIGALLAISPAVTASPSAHASLARKHMHHHQDKKLVKRAQCEFPSGAGLVAVTPDKQNAGWAMSPDQPCKPGMYCPYACPPGQLMAQWDPKATSYSYPASMNGGLYCDENGEIQKPFEDKPYCYDGTGSYKVKNECGKSVAICQTVLPGNEAMLIPTVVGNTATLAVPDTRYWCKTAAHYYVNPPGVSAADGCIWGSKDKPHGNWAPYVAGANQMDNGETFVTIGWNPIYIEPDVPFRTTVPDYGIRVECDGKCNGLPCEIDPAKHGVNELSQKNPPGAGGANFCVVTVPKGSTATLVVFNKDGTSGGPVEEEPKEDDKKDDDKKDDDKKEDDKKDEKPTSTKTSSQPKTTTTKSGSKTTSSGKVDIKISNVDDEEETTTKSKLPTYTNSPKGNKQQNNGIFVNNNTSPDGTTGNNTSPTGGSTDKGAASTNGISRAAAVLLPAVIAAAVFAL